MKKKTTAAPNFKANTYEVTTTSEMLLFSTFEEAQKCYDAKSKPKILVYYDEKGRPTEKKYSGYIYT